MIPHAGLSESEGMGLVIDWPVVGGEVKSAGVVSLCAKWYGSRKEQDIAMKDRTSVEPEADAVDTNQGDV